MKYTALIGNPTGHSISHIMYEELVRAAGFSFPYKHIKIDSELSRLKSNLGSFQDLGFSGINVTLPFKISIMQFLDEVDNEVNELGAVNTVKFGDKTVGYNTDWPGIYIPLNALGGNFDIVTIFGTGGAARAAIYAAKKLKARTIYVHYRSEKISQNTQDLLDKEQSLGITLEDYSNVQSTVEKSDLVINATSAGMIGKDKQPFLLSELDNVELADKFFLDAVFNPTNTPLLRYFKSKDSQTIDGLWMMIYQGVAALKIWLNRDVVIPKKRLQEIHNLLEQELANV